MRTLIIDGEYMVTKELLYMHLNRVLSLPSYFGNNLDALWDTLNEVTEPTTIEFIHTEAVRENLGNYGEKLLTLFEQLAAENKYYNINFYSGKSNPGSN